jgi:hypothetical protein
MKQKRNTVAVLSQSIDARPGGQACGSLIRFDDFDPHAAGGAPAAETRRRAAPKNKPHDRRRVLAFEGNGAAWRRPRFEPRDRRHSGLV